MAFCLRPGLVSLLGTTALAMFVGVVARAQDEMKVLIMPKTNPTSYEFALPKNDLRTKILEVLTLSHQAEQPIFGGVVDPTDAAETPGNFEVSDSTNPIWGKDLLTRPENIDDLYLQNFHTSFWRSPVYRVRDRGLPFLAEFHVHFTATGPSATRVSVTALRTEVLNGSKFGVTHDGFGRMARYVPVAPTTIEEYTILRYFGQAAGVRDMPPVLLPTNGR